MELVLIYTKKEGAECARRFVRLQAWGKYEYPRVYSLAFFLNCQILRKQLTALYLSGWIKMHSKLIVKSGIPFYSSRLLVLESYYTNIKRKESPARGMLILPSK